MSDPVIEIHGAPHQWPPRPLLCFVMKDGSTGDVFADAKRDHECAFEEAHSMIYLISGTAVLDDFPVTKHGLQVLTSKLEKEGEAVETFPAGAKLH